jgi:hypothetical protein
MNDYERRFQRSLQKLSIPSWFIDADLSRKDSSKQSIVSISPMPLATVRPNRLPEIVQLHRYAPATYRSCRSSLATSPSPSAHSWHPNCIRDGMSSSRRFPTSFSREKKYEKGIERVSKSSHWYQPARLVVNHSTGKYIRHL